MKDTEYAINRLTQIRNERCEIAKRVLYRMRIELEEIQSNIPIETYGLKLLLPAYSDYVYIHPLEVISRNINEVSVEIETALEEIERECRGD